tara:strand:+ start:296 stop:856 length:561 start_codon:yes stop_codon:yes gene_type:complete
MGTLNLNSGTITGLNAGGLPDASVQAADLASGVGGKFGSYAILEHQESDGTAGGTLTSGDWRTRPLNTEVTDPDGIVSISSNQFTLQAGTYLIEWRMPGYHCETWQSRLQNITDTSTVALGESHYTRSLYHQHWGQGAVRVTISGAKAFEIQQYAYSTSSTNGMGFPTSNSTGVEVYARVKIYKEA